MCPFVFRFEHHPCLMPGQSHCSHTVTLHRSVCPVAVGTVVSSQALSCYCGAPLTGPAAVRDRSNTYCYIIARLEHQDLEVRMKQMAFQLFWHSLTSPLWIIRYMIHLPKYLFHLVGIVKHKNRAEMVADI